VAFLHRPPAPPTSTNPLVWRRCDNRWSLSKRAVGRVDGQNLWFYRPHTATDRPPSVPPYRIILPPYPLPNLASIFHLPSISLPIPTTKRTSLDGRTSTRIGSRPRSAVGIIVIIIIIIIIMGKAIPRRELTGLARRESKKIGGSYRAELHLSTSEVGFRDKLHKSIVASISTAHLSRRRIPTLLVLSWIFRNTNRAVQAQMINVAIRVLFARAQAFTSLFRRLFLWEAELFDIPEEELENHQMHRMDQQHVCIDTWSDQELYDNTGFRREQIEEIYELFGLERHANTLPNTGKIRIWTGFRYCHFDPEELFLFVLVRCRTGYDNKHLSKHYFGGHASRWRVGFPWIVRYLDARYERTLSHAKLVDFLPQFGKFKQAINAYMQEDYLRHNHDRTSTTHGGLNHCPFPIFAFIDCSIDKVCRPRSGPDGDYIGAPRKEHEQEVQESVYTGFKKYHGIKNEVLELPNGICTLFGPTSARIHDVGGVMQMSNLDNFLTELQADQPNKYIAFGDGAYNANYLNCEYILSYCCWCVRQNLTHACPCSLSTVRFCFTDSHPELLQANTPRAGINRGTENMQPTTQNFPSSHRT
jgi:hypothetical protein